ncbi:MAG: cell division protein ZapA [Treponema sp.]
MGTLKIDILGTSLEIKSDGESAYLDRLLGYYKRKTEEIEKSVSIKDPLKISILTGLDLCDELYKEQKKNAGLTDSITNDSFDIKTDEVMRKLIEKIDKAL